MARIYHADQIKKHRFSASINRRLNALIALDNWHGPLAILQDYSIIAGAISLYFIHPYLYPLTVIIIGSRLGALSNLAHEAGHKRLAKNRTLNYLLGTFFTGYLVLQEFHAYVDMHVKRHHINFGSKKSDPDYCYHIEEGLYGKYTKDVFLKKYIYKPLLLNGLINYVKHILVSRGPNYQAYKFYFYFMYAYLGIIFSLLLYLKYVKYLFLFWLIPYFTVFQLIGWFIDIAEHFPLMNNKIDIQMSRNRFSHPIEAFFFNAHNENYHLVHHLRPAIPFWNLPKAHKILMEDSDYADANRNVGGIFLSSNSCAPLIKTIFNEEQAFQEFFKPHTNK